MKKLCFVFIFFVFIGFSIFGNTGELPAGPQEEIDFLLFQPNSGSHFADEEQAMIHLDNVAEYLKGRDLSPGQIRVDGYAAIAVNDIDSLDLSMERALFVINELKKRGVPDILFADPVAFGEVDFWGSNTDENERSQNRRVRILLDGLILTSSTIEAFDSEDDASGIDERAEEVKEEKTTYRFPWILLLIPLLAAIIFFALKSRKKESAAGDVLSAASAAISYTVVNLEDEIRFRAYELYLERNGQNEDAYWDWCKAVFEICTRYEAAGYETYTEDKNWWARLASSSVG